MSNFIASNIPTNYTTAVYSTITLASILLAYQLLSSKTPKPTPVLPASEMKTVVILGGSYAGITTAHKLLKASASTGDVKVILVSPNTHLYWSLATVRAIIPGQFADEKLLQPIAPGFKQYRADQFEFIVATAEGLDLAGKKVTISSKTGTNILPYDILVLATGSSTKSEAPWKAQPTYEATRDQLHDYQSRVKKANSIVVVGGGATGVETSGELGFEYGKTKKITLIASGSHILEGTPASVTKTATKLLRGLNVELKLSTKVVGDAKMPDGRTELTLSSGEKVVTDLYLPTVGLTPNSSYIPADLLNGNGFVIVDEYLRVKGHPDVWAVGDVSAVQRPQLVNAMKQVAHAAKNIGLAIKGQNLVVYKTGGGDMLAVPVGRKSGTGHMGNWKLPGFMINMVKGKTLFTENLPKTIDGSA
ncbi:FAD/NAD(P)-binding domain-containing protein [Acephala macrosclerotiorum]|nr:FAD/NAD(P)-binding domain-containing protein [Acephala macrosclerotiorum]